MNDFMRTGAVVAACLTLTACGGSSTNNNTNVLTGEPTRFEKFTQREDRFGTLVDNVTALPGTAFEALPDSGRVGFTGMTGIALTTDAGDDVTLLGFAEVTADFDAGTVSGSLSSLQGFDGDASSPGNVFNADGVVELGVVSEIGSGAFDGATANGFVTDYEGVLETTDGRQISLSGLAEGQFRGTRINPSDPGASSIKALVAGDADVGATIDGEAVSGQLAIVAQN